MRIKGVSAAKGGSDILHLESAPALNRRILTSRGSNSNPALTVYLLEQQKRRLIKEREKLELKHIANERKLLAVSKELDRLTTSNSPKEKRGAGKEEKEWNKIRLNY